MGKEEAAKIKTDDKKNSIDKTLMKKLAKKDAKQKVKYMKQRKAMQAERDGKDESAGADDAAPEALAEPVTTGDENQWDKKSAQQEAISYLQV